MLQFEFVKSNHQNPWFPLADKFCKISRRTLTPPVAAFAWNLYVRSPDRTATGLQVLGRSFNDETHHRQLCVDIYQDRTKQFVYLVARQIAIEHDKDSLAKRRAAVVLSEGHLDGLYGRSAACAGWCFTTPPLNTGSICG